MHLKLVILVGPPGSGKSTRAKAIIAAQEHQQDWCYVNQDTQGKDEHREIFMQAIYDKKNIVVDRMNFNVKQRERYIEPAQAYGYHVEIHVIHENYETCYKRCMMRENHPTVKTAEDARSALDFFFKNYEKPMVDEYDELIESWPQTTEEAVVCDLDGTLCNTDHRQKYMEGPRKDWKMWNATMVHDTVHKWCRTIVNQLFHVKYKIILCSGREDSYKNQTVEWLAKNMVNYDNLVMRMRGDHRKDSVVKEIILDFEILTRYTPIVFIDDRQQVVDMYRRRGYTVLQCAKGDF